MRSRLSLEAPPTTERRAVRPGSLRTAVERLLTAHLRSHAPAPIAVALSGGGDSVALLALTAAWARVHRRPVLSLTVDHGLQLGSAAWSEAAAAIAARLGAAHRILPWTAAKPAKGLSAAARTARHALLGDAARAAGASVILMGHTADDRLEADLMRTGGSTLGRLRPWSPSPAWPEGRGVFLLRPLLDVRRATIRRWLIEQGLTWIEDPANADPRSARARARLATAGAPDPAPAERLRRSPLLDAAEVTADGRIVIAREVLVGAPDARRFAAAALACVSGRSTPVRAGRIEALLERLRATADVTATLGGARIEATSDQVTFARNAGEMERGGLAPVRLRCDGAVVWDGRFEAGPGRPDLTLRPLRGCAARLPEPQRRALAALPVSARGALPVALDPNGAVVCPLLDAHGTVRLTSLVAGRWAAAMGGITTEA